MAAVNMLQSEQLININEFKQDLQRGFSDLIDSIDYSLLTSEFPLAINREWLAARVTETMEKETYHILSNDTNVANSQLEKAQNKLLRGLGSLIRLPRELRDTIYPQLMASGHIDIFQASPVLMMEASKYLFKDGICRMNFGVRQNIPTMNPNQELADRIRSISINVSTHCSPIPGCLPELNILTKFGGSKVVRETCTVTFECWPTSFRMVAYEVLNILKTFTGFDEVVLIIKLEWSDEPWPESLYDFQKGHIWSSIKLGIDIARDCLEPTLGNGEEDWEVHVDMPTIIFHPRKPSVAVVEEVEGGEEDEGK